MYDKKTLYALNKLNPDAIVYPSVTGKSTRLKCSDFASEEEFLEWKVWSDWDLHSEEKRDHVEGNHTISVEELSDEALVCPAIDVVMERDEARHDHLVLMQKQVREIQLLVTPKQFRRLWQCYACEEKEGGIAKKEAVSQQAISRSLVSAIKKIKNFSFLWEKML